MKKRMIKTGTNSMDFMLCRRSPRSRLDSAIHEEEWDHETKADCIELLAQESALLTSTRESPTIMPAANAPKDRFQTNRLRDDHKQCQDKHGQDVFQVGNLTQESGPKKAITPGGLGRSATNAAATVIARNPSMRALSIPTP